MRRVAVFAVLGLTFVGVIGVGATASAASPPGALTGAGVVTGQLRDSGFAPYPYALYATIDLAGTFGQAAFGEHAGILHTHFGASNITPGTTVGYPGYHDMWTIDDDSYNRYGMCYRAEITIVAAAMAVRLQCAKQDPFVISYPAPVAPFFEIILTMVQGGGDPTGNVDQAVQPKPLAGAYVSYAAA